MSVGIRKETLGKFEQKSKLRKISVSLLKKAPKTLKQDNNFIYNLEDEHTWA